MNKDCFAASLVNELPKPISFFLFITLFFIFSPSAALSNLITEPVFNCNNTGSQHQPPPLFESIAVRPFALSNDENFLYVVNTPERCLEIYSIDEKGNLSLASSVRVGLEPVAVAERKPGELWVVNHLSDNISIIDLRGRPHIKQIVQVGDAPWDIVFANKTSAKTNKKERAFISASFRGQHHPEFDSSFLRANRMPSREKKGKGELIGRADLWVFDVDPATGEISRAGNINLATDSVRSLSHTVDGNKVFALAFKSGNRTAVAPVGRVKELIGARWSTDGMDVVESRIMIQQQGDRWVDVEGRDWSQRMNVNVVDNDFFVISAVALLDKGTAEKPEFNRKAILDSVKGLGTILYNGVSSAGGEHIYIVGTDARNLIPNENNLNANFVSNNLYRLSFGEKKSVSTESFDQFSGVIEGTGSALPMAMALDEKRNRLFVGFMGGNQIAEFKLDSRGKLLKPVNVIVQRDSKDLNALGGGVIAL
ncbi:MAG: hypothetical protein KDI30_03555, partial [Pseudomonadales bacterium]|nr:hypothetical protein [Pseudomonadales bacterium]